MKHAAFVRVALTIASIVAVAGVAGPSRTRA